MCFKIGVGGGRDILHEKAISSTMRKLSMEELGRHTPDAFREEGKLPIVIVLDNIRSALNIGSAFRTADAFALEKILLCGISATPPHREILKTALGSTETVSWEYVSDTTAAVVALKLQGFEVWAVEQVVGSKHLQNFEFPLGGKVALVFGNEVSGVGEHSLAVCDGFLEIPQFGTKHSLNVAVCAGIVTWELVKKLKFPEKQYQITQR
jgi:23S rRNA (guanosine2251-2'-O)-methyltransferase